MRSFTRLPLLLIGAGFILIMVLSPLAADEDGHKLSRKSFVNSMGMKMIGVKGGSFDAWTPSLARYGRMMGIDGRPDVAFALNRPRVTTPVTVDDYVLSAFPVTNAMYRQFVEETGHRRPEGKLVDFFWKRSRASPWDLDDFKGNDLPVTGVQNADIIAFCKWLSQKEGRQYRAPTIHEFEYANRAGTDTRFWWGDKPDVRKMNFGPSLIGHPTPVGSYPPNPWGFYGMHGNVWEYCYDEGRYMAMGSAFNCPQSWTGVDAFGNFHEGPQKMRLLTSSFRLACDADQGAARPADRSEPTVVATNAGGPQFPRLKITVGERIDLGTIPNNASLFMITRGGTWVLNNKRSTDRGKTWQSCETLGEAFCQLRDGTIIAIPGSDSGGGPARFKGPLVGRSSLRVQVSDDDWQTVRSHTASLEVPLAEFFLAVRGLIELEDGRLLMTMYGRMDGDHVREDSPVGYELDNQWIKTRVITVQSSDRGRSWQYLSTLSYHP
ncbi:MAG: SUMF1/EgtB/PvdO family nonheme iron enzyme, partial [Pirellulaceae bacterium]|nr:SUMF1/EgtB/PvdO family nonheme iron enzyme [Pirellulaceae bacterium]